MAFVSSSSRLSQSQSAVETDDRVSIDSSKSVLELLLWRLNGRGAGNTHTHTAGLAAARKQAPSATVLVSGSESMRTG